MYNQVYRDANKSANLLRKLICAGCCVKTHVVSIAATPCAAVERYSCKAIGRRVSSPADGCYQARCFVRRRVGGPSAAAGSVYPTVDSASGCILRFAVVVEEQLKGEDTAKLRRCGPVYTVSLFAGESKMETPEPQEASDSQSATLHYSEKPGQSQDMDFVVSTGTATEFGIEAEMTDQLMLGFGAYDPVNFRSDIPWPSISRAHSTVVVDDLGRLSVSGCLRMFGSVEWRGLAGSGEVCVGSDCSVLVRLRNGVATDNFGNHWQAS